MSSQVAPLRKDEQYVYVVEDIDGTGTERLMFVTEDREKAVNYLRSRADMNSMSIKELFRVRWDQIVPRGYCNEYARLISSYGSCMKSRATTECETAYAVQIRTLSADIASCWQTYMLTRNRMSAIKCAESASLTECEASSIRVCEIKLGLSVRTYCIPGNYRHMYEISRTGS